MSWWKNFSKSILPIGGAVLGGVLGGPVGAMVGLSAGGILGGLGGGSSSGPKQPSITVPGGDISSNAMIAQADEAGDEAANNRRKQLARMISGGRAGTVHTSSNKLRGGGAL